MENEKLDLIDRKKVLENLDKFVNPMPDENGLHYLSGLSTAITEIVDAPTVDAVVLPCKVGTQVWLTKWWCIDMRWLKVFEPKPRNIHHFEIAKDGIFAHFHDGCINVKYFGEIVFFTREEAEAALAEMDGGDGEWMKK